MTFEDTFCKENIFVIFLSWEAHVTEKKKQKLILWQPMMLEVIYALIPIGMASIFFFGWKSLLVLLVVNAAGFLTEYAFTKSWGQPVSSAVFVTCLLFALSLPPTLPIWMAVVGIRGDALRFSGGGADTVAVSVLRLT